MSKEVYVDGKRFVKDAGSDVWFERDGFGRGAGGPIKKDPSKMTKEEFKKAREQSLKYMIGKEWNWF